MLDELGWWALLFIMYIGAVWITLTDRLRRIEKLLLSARLETDNKKNDSSSKEG